ncbi:MAG: hypothetical protein PVH77_02085 [Phycisphaerales bacterium]|jgi:hypothetical protein
MIHKLINKTGVKFIVIACLILLAQTSFVRAGDITGEWEMKMDFGGRESFATLTISKNADGALSGKWGSQDLSDVKFKDGKLTFVRTIRFGDQEFTMDYEGTLKDGKITGTMSSDRGDFSANGSRRKPKPPILGVWDISFDVDERVINAKLSVSQKPDGTIDAKWNETESENALSNVKLKDGKLALTRDTKFQDFEFQTTCELTAKGNKISGTMQSDMGELEVKGKRVGAAIIGKWELTIDSDWGTRPGMMRIDGDLTGRYEMFGGEIPMKNLKIEGDQVTFTLEMGFGDQTFETEFKGKLEGNTIKGEMSSDMGTSDIVGKKVEKAMKAVPLAGTWEFTRETPRGTRTSTLKIKKDMTGTYTIRDNETPITDLKVDGDNVSFKITMRWRDREFQMEFKGKLDGKDLKGEFITERGAREAMGKRVD